MSDTNKRNTVVFTDFTQFYSKKRQNPRTGKNFVILSKGEDFYSFFYFSSVISIYLDVFENENGDSQMHTPARRLL